MRILRNPLTHCVMALLIFSPAAAFPRAITSCSPTVRVMPGDSKANRVIAVYWDVSKSMRHYLRITRVLVESLDSAIAPEAGVTGVKNFAVGETVSPAADATVALSPDSGWTALHTAGLKASNDLAAGDVGAAIFISDMVLEVPVVERKSGRTACPGVPMPSVSHAGALFGRCVSAGFGTRSMPQLFAQVYKIDALYVLLVGTNTDLCRALAKFMTETWKSSWSGLQTFAIADTGAILSDSANSVICSWKPSEFQALRVANAAAPGECRFRCADDSAIASMHCTVMPTAVATWLHVSPPTGTTLASGFRFSRTTAADASGFTIQVQCPGERKLIQTGTTLKYPWRWSVPASISTDADVRRLFEGLVQAIAGAAPPRSLEVTFAVQ
jgi:hypothetical protein